jgi:excisionase family DNA binding protein
MTDDDKLRTIDLQEASQLTGIPLSTLYKLIDRGELKTVPTGRRIRIRVSTLRTWLEQSEARACQNDDGAVLPFAQTDATKRRSR